MLESPYFYGNPVPLDKFIDRSDELMMLHDRLRKRESTALVGEPHIGKTSLLLKFQDQAKTQTQSTAERFIFCFMDLHPIEEDFTPQDFWAEALKPLEEEKADSIQESLREVRAADYARRPLTKMFKTLGQNDCCLALLLDEFDRLLSHSNFQSHQFFALLRHLATLSGGLTVITATRWSMAQMNRWGRGILPVGSPLFNYMIEQRLRPFEERYVAELLDSARDRFKDADRRFIRRIAGRQPFLLQAAADSVFKAKDSGQARLAKAGARFYEHIASHFDDLWDSLDDNARTTAVILSLMELGGKAMGSRFAYGEIERVRNFGPELHRLEELGLAERVGKKGWQFDTEHLLPWQGERWTIAAQAFTWWVRDVVIAGQRSVPAYDEWLAAHRYRALLTQEQWDKLLDAVQKLPDWAKRNVGTLARLLTEELLKRLPLG